MFGFFLSLVLCVLYLKFGVLLGKRLEGWKFSRFVMGLIVNLKVLGNWGIDFNYCLNLDLKVGV